MNKELLVIIQAILTSASLILTIVNIFIIKEAQRIIKAGREYRNRREE